jgi:hypothetical protein
MITERKYDIIVDKHKCVVKIVLNSNLDLYIEIENLISKDIYIHTAGIHDVKQLTRNKTIMTSKQFFEVLHKSITNEKNYSYFCGVEPHQMIFGIEMLIPLNDIECIRHEFEIILSKVDVPIDTKLTKVVEDIDDIRQKLETIEYNRCECCSNEREMMDVLISDVEETKRIVDKLVIDMSLQQTTKSNIVNMEVFIDSNRHDFSDHMIKLNVTKKLLKSSLLIESSLSVYDVNYDSGWGLMWNLNGYQHFIQVTDRGWIHNSNLVSMCYIDDQNFVGSKELTLTFTNGKPNEKDHNHLKGLVTCSVIKVTEYLR